MKQYVLMGIILFLAIIVSGFANNFIDDTNKPRTIFYLHGKILEDKGKDAVSEEYGTYDYDDMISIFQRNGFIVKSEIREHNTDPNEYADKICYQISELINSGVKAEDITIVGASKGAVIAMLVSTQMKNQNLNFVLIANCNNWVEENFEIDLSGNVLSIYESSDKIGQSCDSIFSKSSGIKTTKEIKLHSGKGHGICYKPLDEWIIPTIEWAKDK